MNTGIAYFLPLVLLFLVYIFPAIVNRRLAIRRGRNVFGWIISVIWLSWLSTLILYSLQSKLTPDQEFQMSLEEKMRDSLKGLPKDLKK